ncbi:MAG: D-alanyl-D-alanine carboxypeptidase family protein [Clostridiaceae bacterium]|nr:D-alanyl-D-alanine carboxypeptidase family protein [Clostridiaceae bacterium]
MIVKKIIGFSVAVLLCFCECTSINAVQVSAKSAVLYDPLTGMILESKNPDECLPMASTTKIMTALVALSIYDLDKEVTILPGWTGAEGSSMYLKAGEKMKVSDLIYGLMLMSGNDAAVALSAMLTGNTDDFVTLMNRTAKELGMTSSSFENPNGLDGDNHYSTASDMALLAAAAMKNSVFREIVAKKSIQAGGRYMTNHNRLLSLYSDACGIKTGYTKKSGRCLVSAAERDGRELIAVTLSAPDDWNDHMSLYESAFSQLSSESLLRSGEVGSAYIASGTTSNCPLYVNEGFTIGVFPGERERIKITICGPRIVYAPVYAGDKYGHIIVTLDGNQLFSTDVYYKNDIEQMVYAENEGFWSGLFDWIFRK